MATLKYLRWQISVASKSLSPSNSSDGADTLVRLPNERIPKQIFYGQLTDGKRLTHEPKKRFRLLEINLQKMRHKLRFMRNTNAKQVNLGEVLKKPVVLRKADENTPGLNAISGKETSLSM